jgi:hypothetical protein
MKFWSFVVLCQNQDMIPCFVLIPKIMIIHVSFLSKNLFSIFDSLFYFEMESFQVKDLPRYSLSLPADNYQRHFNYENKIVNEEKKQVRICRKCNTLVSRPNGDTAGLKKHMKMYQEHWCSGSVGRYLRRNG